MQLGKDVGGGSDSVESTVRKEGSARGTSKMGAPEGRAVVVEAPLSESATAVANSIERSEQPMKSRTVSCGLHMLD